MTFQQIKYVMEIAECGSINKATQKLFIAQPYLSSKLKELENEIGITLFTRSNKGVFLTEAGKEFLSYAKPLYEQREKLLEMYSGETREYPLRFSISSQRYPFIVQAFLNFYHDKNLDQYEFCMKETGMYEVIDDVFERKSEIGIIFISDMSKKFIGRVLEWKGIEFEELKSITPCVFFKKDHPMASKKVIKIEEMAPYPYVVFEREKGAAIDYAEEIALHDFKHSGKRIIVADRATMYNILSHTEGFSIGSGILPAGYAIENLCSAPIANHDGEMKLGWIKLKNSPISEEMAEFLEHIKKLL
ncbi:MAG: LysR family transcriptional regulator [Epulopiscium sp.]|nr:LysR family transcriptional regulator [Candidatus Epulonipiscium sp.]